MYEIEWSEEAKADVRRISAFARRPVMNAIRELRAQAQNETRNRRPLRRPLEDLPDATWQVRVSDWRCFYRISREQTVRILRVIFKGTGTTSEAVAKDKRR